MGWDFTCGASKKDVVASLTFDAPRRRDTSWSNAEGKFVETGLDVERKTVRSRVVGSRLWVVAEVARYDGGREVSRKRFIVCYLLEKHGDDWGYKAIPEEMEPFYYDCPPAFLALAPVASVAWREGVAAWRARKDRVLCVGKSYALRSCCIDVAKIVSVAPRRIVGAGPDGRLWSLSKDSIGEEVAV